MMKIRFSSMKLFEIFAITAYIYYYISYNDFVWWGGLNRRKLILFGIVLLKKNERSDT